jgi:hypothetical protein
MSYAPATSKPAVPIVVVPVGVVRPAAPLYSNLGKGAKDLLSKGFPSTHKVEVTTSAENGFQFVSSAEKKQANKADVVVGTFQPKYKIISRGIELIGTFDTANQIKGELTMENLLVPGVKGTFKAQTGASSDLEAAFEYKHEAGTFTSTIVHNPIASSTLLSATATVSRQAITAGLESKYAISTNLPGTLTTVTGALNYKAATHDLTAFVYALFPLLVPSRLVSSSNPLISDHSARSASSANFCIISNCGILERALTIPRRSPGPHTLQ